MKQSTRGPVVLTFAGFLMVSAILAYLLGDVEANRERREAILRDRRILHDQNERLIADRAVLNEQATTLSACQTELCRQKKVTVELLRRLDELIKEVAVLRGRSEDCDRSRKKQAEHS